MSKRFTVIAIIIGSLSLNYLKSQSCLETLQTAEKSLDAGKPDECLNLCRNCTLPKNEPGVRSQAYRLMCIAWIQKSNQDSARWAAEKMLGINPAYKTDLLKDPTEFTNLIKSIVVIPKFSLGIAFSAGTNTTYPVVSNSYVLADYLKSYKGMQGLQFSMWFGFNLSPGFIIELGAIANTKKFEINYAPTNWKVQVNEKLSYLEIPLNLKYQKPIYKNISIGLCGGVFGGYLVKDLNNFKSTYIPENKVFELQRLNVLDRRNRINYGLTYGMGFYYKAKQGQFSIQANYYKSGPNINNASKRWDFPEQIYTYYYVDDDIKLNNLAISLGYTYYLNYKVSKRKK